MPVNPICSFMCYGIKKSKKKVNFIVEIQSHLFSVTELYYDEINKQINFTIEKKEDCSKLKYSFKHGKKCKKYILVYDKLYNKFPIPYEVYHKYDHDHYPIYRNKKGENKAIRNHKNPGTIIDPRE